MGVILGPTAIGKTRLALALEERLAPPAVEIVSADSRQFYRFMDIGTAKPTPEARARIPHHLVDIADPDETVGLAVFLRLARRAIAEITERGKLPLVVGGTGQYIRALVQGWRVPNVPPDPALRAQLEAEDLETLWARLIALDPEAAEFVDRHNPRRVIRALEVCLKSGQPFSDLRRRVPPPYAILQIGLTMEREALYARADARVDAMMQAGLLDEVRHLLARGYGWELPAMSGLGYAQFRPYVAGEATLDEVVARIKLDTHDFIRRQYTWFRRKDPQVHWLDATDDPQTKAAQLIQRHLTDSVD